MTHGCASVVKKAAAVALRVLCMCVCVCVWQGKWLKKEMGFVLTEANDSDNQTLPPTHSHTHRQEAHTDKLSCSFFHLHTWALIRHTHARTHAHTVAGWNDPPIYSSSVCTAERWWTWEDGLQSPAGTHTHTQQAQQMHPHTLSHIHTHTHTHIHTHTHTHAHTHAHMHARTHAHTHTDTLGPSADRWKGVGEVVTDSGSRSIVNSESV